jgi:hypothetical protein
LTNSDWYVTIKTMERDFWNRNRLLGHMPLLVSPMKGLMNMTTLAAKGYTTDGVPVYLWAYGNYRYEVEVKKLNFSDCVVFEGPYEDAVSRFEDRAINGVEMY